MGVLALLEYFTLPSTPREEGLSLQQHSYDAMYPSTSPNSGTHSPMLHQHPHDTSCFLAYLPPGARASWTGWAIAVSARFARQHVGEPKWNATKHSLPLGHGIGEAAIATLPPSIPSSQLGLSTIFSPRHTALPHCGGTLGCFFPPTLLQRSGHGHIAARSGTGGTDRRLSRIWRYRWTPTCALGRPQVPVRPAGDPGGGPGGWDSKRSEGFEKKPVTGRKTLVAYTV